MNARKASSNFIHNPIPLNNFPHGFGGLFGGMKEKTSHTS